MCGINGFTWNDEALIKRMNSCTSHRGPDGSGVYVNDRVTLGHNRLAILDLREIADQPMWDNARELVIIYNGELYNFKELRRELESEYEFKTSGDTEVFLAAYRAWGTDMLKRLNGMFAFAIFDTRDGSLFLARDQVGIKPLYYHWNEGRLAFSSEIKALTKLDIPRTLDKQAFMHYMRFLYVPEPFTLLSSIRKVPPAHYLMFKNGKLSIERYWSAQASKHSSDIRNDVQSCVQGAVTRQLVSDKPLGVYLSGGIDSSIVLDCATKANGNMNTFSVGFDLGEGEESEKFNRDFAIARKTAAHYGATHHEVRISSEEVPELLERVIWYLDEPVANATTIAQYTLSKFAKQHVDVVLGGDGGDELFGGYPRHRLALAARYYQRVPELLRRVGDHVPSLQKLNTKSGAPLIQLFHGQKDASLKRVLASEFVNDTTNEFIHTHFVEKSCSSYEQLLMEFDLTSWLVDESLLRSDKLAMAHGLEQRVPLLDREIVELAHGIPSTKKVSLFDTKIILKEAFRDRLPDYLFKEPKRGWFSPGAKWFRHPQVTEFVRTVLRPQYTPVTESLFRWDELTIMLDEHLAQKTYHYQLLMAVVTFQIWAKRFAEEIEV